MPSRHANPVEMAFKILIEYQQSVRDTLEAAGCSDELMRKILKDLYIRDDIYLSINRPYKCAEESFENFCSRHKLDTALFRYEGNMFPRFNEAHLYIHQVQAIESILDNRTTIISTGTGSGKTESFLIPLLNYCIKNRGMKGIKAIILYPMNALAGDQLRRIEKAVEGHAITVKSFIGSTSREERAKIIDDPPDIFITNYVMLDRLITKTDTRSMFERSVKTLHYLVVDEIHYYRGTKGANLCVLLRRLRTLCENKFVQIGASATLRQGGGYYSDDDQEQIKTYARTLFGQEAADNFRFVTPVYNDEYTMATEVEPLPETDRITGEALLEEVDGQAVRALANQLAGVQLPKVHPGRKEIDPLYQFAQHNQFLVKMRDELRKRACTVDELTELFRLLYIDNHQREPRSPREIVHAYLSAVNELNRLCASGSKSVPEILLDYRLHLILSNLGGSLTRCLYCGRYHDGVRTHCISCNGLLFRVSKSHPDLCLARCDGTFISPNTSLGAGATRKSFIVLVQTDAEQASVPDNQNLYFTIQHDLDADDDDERYILFPPDNQQHTVRIVWPSESDKLQEVELETPRLYWQNVQRIVDALLIKPETKIVDKLLGFIDNREKASGIRFRLRDEIAERTLTMWAAMQWTGSDALPLMVAFSRLEKQAQPIIMDNQDIDVLLCELLQEMPFWFARMLTRLDEYDTWQVALAEGIAQALQPDELALIREVFLSRNAIDRTAFPMTNNARLKHFYLEKYRVETEFGIGLESTKEAGYDIISLGERGVIYQHIIDRFGVTRIRELLDSLCLRGLLVSKQTRNSVVFYQLNPSYLILACHAQPIDAPTHQLSPLRIECHTADHSSNERADFEKKFSDGEIHALICTPTLEMGVDIGGLSCVTMIGFPPSPANYAQRAGRAGRVIKSRSATIVVLSSPGNNHDTYYAADPRKMIDGTITPPQFTLTNFKLLAAHVYAHILAGNQLCLLNTIDRLAHRIEQFIANDELDLLVELQDDYLHLAEYLHKDIRRLPGQIKDHEQGYRHGYFPDYGFRRDGIPLVDSSQQSADREDLDAGVLTSREPEEAVRKLAPGRIVYCGGRPVRVDRNQERNTYDIEYDPEGKPFRAYKHLLAEKRDQLYIYARRDPDTKYLLTRKVRINEPLSELQVHGPGYCRIYFVRKGTLYIINEGEKRTIEEGEVLVPATPLQDTKGEYRVGARLTRDGLLLSLSEQILLPNTRANFLAVLLRSIPDYFNLDDGELRVITDVKLRSSTGETGDDRKYIFLYGHDESGLVPFERIFANLSTFLTRHLQVLENCTCSDDGCYHCLFSMNSQYLTGTLSRQQAAAFLRAYLQVSLLQPHIGHKTQTSAESDLLLKVEWRNRCVVTAENRNTSTTREYYSDSVGPDQNTVIYTTILKALIAEAASGPRSVKISSNLSHIDAQLRGKAKVNSGQRAFLQVKLALRSLQS